MPTPMPESELARVLPGSWVVAASNFPFWLSGKNIDPVLNYDLLSERPLRFADIVRYSTDAGEHKTIAGVDRVRSGSITRRGRGLLRLLASRWAVIGKNESETVLAIQYEKSLASPAGIDILVRHGVREPEVRSIVAAEARNFGLSLEQFATLYWFGESSGA